jgi:Rod binding domain-containing protein
MSEININKAAPNFVSSGLERLRGPKAKTVDEEKARLKKATQEFEAFFTYQMLKTMRQTVPESPFSKGTPISTDAGKETFTDIFDMEIARKMSTGKAESISDMLFKSLEKLVQNEFDQPGSKKPEIKPLAPEKDSFIEVRKEPRPISSGKSPILLEKPGSGHIQLLKSMNQNETDSAQNLNKKPKAP